MFINGRGGICAMNAYIVAKRKGVNRNGNAYFEESSPQKETNAVEYSRFFEKPGKFSGLFRSRVGRKRPCIFNNCG